MSQGSQASPVGQHGPVTDSPAAPAAPSTAAPPVTAAKAPDGSSASPPAQSPFKRDFVASLVVFLVALPLCMAIGIASGSTASAGIVCGIIGGIVVGLLAGAPLQVSGPAAGLTTLVFGLYQQYPPELVALIITGAGLVQLATGIAGLGRWFRAVSPAVIHGMLAGIGTIIFLQQFHWLFDVQIKGGGPAQIKAFPDTVKLVASGFTGDAAGVKALWAGGIGVACVAIVYYWKSVAPAAIKIVPGSLIAVLFAGTVAGVAGAPVGFISAPGNLLAELTGVSGDSFGKIGDHGIGGIIGSILAVAFIASAETLLCATAVDALHNGPRTQYDRELSAQGVGNTLCGLVGALPMTGVIVRSAANVEAGARSRWSAVMHGFWLLALVAGVPALLTAIGKPGNPLSLIPVTSLAAILVVTGMRLMDFRAVGHLWHVSKGEAFIYIATVVMIVAGGLLTGVLTGVGLAVGKLLWTLSRLQAELTLEPEGKPGSPRGGKLVLTGSATFLGLPALAAELEKVPPGTALHLHMTKLDYIDHACLELLENWEKQHRVSGGSLLVDWDALHGRFKAPGSGSAPVAAKGH